VSLETYDTDERLKEIVAAALLDRTADNVEQVPVAVTVAGAEVTLGAVYATCTLPPPLTCLQSQKHARPHSMSQHSSKLEQSY